LDLRKLIAFGKNSFVVSLPKQWINQNKLKKGDHINIVESTEKLILSPHSVEERTEEKEIVILVENKSLKQIKREIINAYVLNNKTIILKGDDIKEKAKELQDIIQGLIALEVMEQTTTSIVARDFLNVESVSLKTLIRKMDIITRSMWSDCEKMFDEDLHKNIEHRDKDVNKLAFLIFRIVRFGLENPYMMKQKLELSSLDLLQMWLVAYNLESIADEAKRVARYMYRIKLSKEDKKEFLRILGMIKENYLRMLKAYYDKDLKLANLALDKRMEIVKVAEDFYLKNRDVDWMGFMIERTKAAAGHTTSIGRAMYHCL
jgi:phosphate uptake regulator